jgi:hypothetical protein
MTRTLTRTHLRETAMNKFFPVLLAVALGVAGTFASPAFAQIAPPAAPRTPALAPGLYVQVTDGMVNVANKGGTQSFTAGQFGFTPSTVQPPVIVPKNPGIQFTPPPSFSAPSTVTGVASAPKSGAVDCVVR